jgi:hypothetical protein
VVEAKFTRLLHDLPLAHRVCSVSFSAISKTDYLMQKRKESIEAIKYGLKGKIIVNEVARKNVIQTTTNGIESQW